MKTSLFENPSLKLARGPVELSRLEPDHREIFTALAKDSRIWEKQKLDPSDFEHQWFDKAIEQLNDKKRYPFAIQYEGKWAGSSSFYDFDEQHKRLTIGYTWYTPQHWGGALNPSAKLLMLEYAFETLGITRVSFTVDSLNIRSCKALEKLGAQQEGILRQHMIRPDGSKRDTVVFSILDSEWPPVKKGLIERLQGIL